MHEDTVILIAEDDAGHFALVKKNLWRSCVRNEILHFRDGEEILNFFSNGKGSIGLQSGRPYLLLLDIRMPKVDGIEVLRRMKADPKLATIPVIMLTTTDDSGEVDRCYDLGCSFYIVKPPNYADFMACVEQLGAFLSLPTVEIPRADSANQGQGVTDEGG